MKVALTPIVIEKDGSDERSFDIYSRLLRDRIIFIGEPIESNMASSIIAQLLFLEAEDSSKDICIYINSPGGDVTSGLAIYDTMQFIKPQVQTVCVGMAASMAAVLLLAGEKGKRFALPNSEIMIHQPMGGASGQASEIKIAAEHIIKTRDKLNRLISKHTTKNLSTIEEDTDRDKYMTANEALDYGIIDSVLKSRDEE